MIRKTVYQGMLSDFLALDAEFSDEDYYELGRKYYKDNRETIDFSYYEIKLGNYTAIDYDGLGRDIAESFVRE